MEKDEERGKDPSALRRIAELEAKIEELKSRLPAHSVHPSMIEELEELEEALEEAKRAAGEK